MYIAYCKKCNHFSYLSRHESYCRECKEPIMKLSLESNEFFALSLNERYKLAYELSNEK